MYLSHPAFLILAIPGIFLWWKTSTGHSRTVQVLRLILLLLLLLALSQPTIHNRSDGVDTLVVVDRSASMPTNTEEKAEEIVQLLYQSKQPKDRLGILSFAEQLYVESELSVSPPKSLSATRKAPQASNISQSLFAALQQIPTNRSGSILLLTDGQNTGQSYNHLISQAQNLGIPIHIRRHHQSKLNDISVERLEVPQYIDEQDSFFITGWIQSDVPKRVSITLHRNDVPVAKLQRTLNIGSNPIIFQDNPSQNGLHSYTLTVNHKDDPFPQNNYAHAGVWVEGERGILLLTQDGKAGPLGQAIANNALTVSQPGKLQLTPQNLSRFRLLILQNVAANQFSWKELQNIEQAVQHQGMGLLMTGGQASFGVGGYVETPIEKLLPISMEVKHNRRKTGVALAIALDRSGSMSMPVGPNLTKMDLANQGSAAAIEMLSPIDSVAVYAVDTAAHEVLPLTRLNQKDELLDKVMRIRSQGGGIFVKNALKQALKSLSSSPQNQRHVILFADASDAEQTEEVYPLIKQMRQANISISVIALGAPQDKDAQILTSIAAKGEGEIYFTTTAKQLPQLFAMDTMLSLQQGFINGRFHPKIFAGLRLLGGKKGNTFPPIDGYNVSTIRSTAQVGIAIPNEDRDPIIAYHQSGLGKVGVYLGEIGGQFGGNLIRWKGFSAFFHSLVNGLAAPSTGQLAYRNAQVIGNEVVYTIETPNKAPKRAIIQSAVGDSRALVFQQLKPSIFQARTTLHTIGAHTATVQLADNELIFLPPAYLSYHTEYHPRSSSQDDLKQLQRLAARTNGTFNGSIASVWQGGLSETTERTITHHLLLTALIIMLIEIAARRLHLHFPLSFLTSVSKGQPIARQSQPSPTEQVALPHTKKQLYDSTQSVFNKAKKRANRKFKK